MATKSVVNMERAETEGRSGEATPFWILDARVIVGGNKFGRPRKRGTHPHRRCDQAAGIVSDDDLVPAS